MANLPDQYLQYPEPVVESGADPYVIPHGKYFYYCHVVDDQSIYIRKTDTLPSIGQVEPNLVWTPPPGQPYSESLWAPELHHLDNKWYIYFAAGKQDTHYNNQRMYVLEGVGDDPQTANYTFLGKIATQTDEWAIDGTVLNHHDGARYFIWSGRKKTSDLVQHLYIAQMASPTQLLGDRICISSPILNWEKQGGEIAEGPAVIAYGSQRQIIYSASHSTTDNYCLGQLNLIGDDPLNPNHWKKLAEPIFSSRDGHAGPGHASFILTPDETAGWMIYHTARQPKAGWDRQVRIVSFNINEDGTLRFNLKDKRQYRRFARLGTFVGRISHTKSQYS
ncbi:MAG: family 43 glycosylhydrolase [Candidatus Saccharimonadales bacterium]